MNSYWQYLVLEFHCSQNDKITNGIQFNLIKKIIINFYFQPIIKIKTVNTTGSTKIEEIEARMAYRKLKVKEACAKYGLDKEGNDSLHQPNPWEFLINKKYHLVWCNIFKAASTSWMYNFNLLAG